MTLSESQRRVYGAGVAEARRRATQLGQAAGPLIDRVTAMFLTESGGQVLANDGRAFHPDPAKRRPGWDRDDNGRPLPADMLDDLYRCVRRSLELPHDGVGNNGGSTGPGQALSTPYVRIRFPGATWGWGPIEDTMDPTLTARAFLADLRVSDDAVYTPAGGKPITTGSPILADTLRVQRPKITEASSNYGPGRVDEIRAILAELADQPATTPPKENTTVTTKEETQEAFSEALATGPLLRVIRHNRTGVDYVYGPGVFAKVPDEGEFQKLFWGRWIGVQHGDKRQVADDVLITSIREAAERFTPGRTLDPIE